MSYMKNIICLIKGHKIEIINDYFCTRKTKINRYFAYCKRCGEYLCLPLIERRKRV